MNDGTEWDESRSWVASWLCINSKEGRQNSNSIET